MPSDLETYLAEAKERYDLTQAVPYPTASRCHNCIADVKTLVEIVECQRKIIDAKDRVLTAYRFGARRTPERALGIIHAQGVKLDRIARAAMEKQPSQKAEEKRDENLPAYTRYLRKIDRTVADLRALGDMVDLMFGECDIAEVEDDLNFLATERLDAIAEDTRLAAMEMKRE